MVNGCFWIRWNNLEIEIRLNSKFRFRLTDRFECLFEWHRDTSWQLKHTNFWIFVIIYIHCIEYRIRCVENLFVVQMNIAFGRCRNANHIRKFINSIDDRAFDVREGIFRQLFKQITKRIQICLTSDFLILPHTKHWSLVNMPERMVENIELNRYNFVGNASLICKSQSNLLFKLFAYTIRVSVIQTLCVFSGNLSNSNFKSDWHNSRQLNWNQDSFWHLSWIFYGNILIPVHFS